MPIGRLESDQFTVVELTIGGEMIPMAQYFVSLSHEMNPNSINVARFQLFDPDWDFLESLIGRA